MTVPKYSWSFFFYSWFKRIVAVALITQSFLCFLLLQTYTEHKLRRDNNTSTSNNKTSSFGFTAVPASDFYDLTYHGRDHLIIKQLNFTLPVIHRLNQRPVDHRKMHKARESMGVILKGRPGTGKTLFVQKYCAYLDYALHRDKSGDNISGDNISGDTSGDISNNTGDNTGDNISNNISNNINTLPDIHHIRYPNSIVHLYTVRGSDISSKFMGESENIIRRLFSTVQRDCTSNNRDSTSNRDISNNSTISTSNGTMRVNVIFFDEAESFFCKRSLMDQSNQAHQIMLSEFLLQFNALKSQCAPVFFFAATNYPELLDEAVVRRFARRIFFDGVSQEEVMEYVESKGDLYRLNTIEKEELCKMAGGTTHAYLQCILSKFTEFTVEGEYVRFDLERAREYVSREKIV